MTASSRSPTGPGNSLAGLHAANTLGVDVIECDVHEYQGRLEVRHLKTAGPLPFLWDRWELASASAPRLGLAELLEADRHGTTFMLDIKGRRGIDRAGGRRAAPRGRPPPQVLVCGRWWPTVEPVAELPFVAAGALRPQPGGAGAARQRRLTAAPQRPRGLGPPPAARRAGRPRRLHERVEVVMSWPVNDLAALDAVLGLGVTGIISDEPDVLARSCARGG